LTLHELFDETIVVPLLSEAEDVRTLLADGLGQVLPSVDAMAALMIDRLGQVGCKMALRLAERAASTAIFLGNVASNEDLGTAQLNALEEILDDLSGDELTATRLCNVV
jgi:hypothetical protein